SPNISARRCKKCPAPAWHLSASRTTRTSQTSGPISSSPGLMGRRNETRPEGKSQASHWAWLAPVTRLTSCLMRVYWPAQPYRNLAQRPFQSYLIKCFRSCFVHWNRPNQLEQAANAAFELLPIASVEDCL